MGELTTTVPCPGCGVPVAVGYPRCPKCQAVMPGRVKRPTFREENFAGGTSLAAAEGASRAGWFIAIALLVIGAVIAVYFATGGDAKSDDIPPEEDVVDEGDDEATAVEDEADEDVEAPVRPTNPAGTAVPSQAELSADVLRRIDAGLREQRLWAKVRREGDVLVIESSLCAEAGVREMINAEAVALREAGFEIAQCRSPNGSVDYEAGLVPLGERG